MRISAAQPSYHDCRWCLRVLRFVQLEARLNATEEEKVWLTVGIPTVPRKTGADYLTRTLETLLEELPADDTDPLYGRVRVLVMNNRPGNHSVFYGVRSRIPFLCFCQLMPDEAAVSCTCCMLNPAEALSS